MALVEIVYRATAAFPHDARFGLTRQMRRAAVPAAANIAEGAARSSTKELLQYLGIASGSLSELDTHCAVARRLGFPANGRELDARLEEAFALLIALSASLKRKPARSLAPSRIHDFTRSRIH